jgi:hypothetical protein
MSAASIKKKAADRRAAGKGPKNTSYTTADGKGVRIKNGVKTYSDKPVNVKGRSGQSISGRDYSINKGGTGYALTTDQLGTTSPVIPERPQPDNVGDMLGMNNASVLQEGLTLQGGQIVRDEKDSDQMSATKEYNANIGNVANAMLGYLKPEDNQAANLFQDTYGISDREAGRDLRNAERAKNQYTNQLNTLTASRDAEMLKLEGQGRGQTSGFIGGEQARINREAAIQALPIQAQLAAAQADYETAKSHVDTLFQLKLKDIDTQQAYKTTVANTFMSVATAQQQNLLNAAIADSNARAEEKKIAMNDAKSIAMQAIEYGQSSLARSVMSLDPTSPTYQEDVLEMMGQLSKPVAAVSSPWKLQDVNGVSSWVNSDTQEIKPVGGVDGSNLKPVKDLEIRDLNDTWTAKNSIVSIIDNMTKSIEENGTKIFWGSAAGERGANKTNLLLAMKNLEKTGALDKGTIDVLSDLIPENEFWATEDRQIASLNQLKENIIGKTDEFVGSYRGTTAEIDPRTKRIYGTVDISTLPRDTISEVYSLFGVNQLTDSENFNADEWLK